MLSIKTSPSLSSTNSFLSIVDNNIFVLVVADCFVLVSRESFMFTPPPLSSSATSSTLSLTFTPRSDIAMINSDLKAFLFFSTLFIFSSSSSLSLLVMSSLVNTSSLKNLILSLIDLSTRELSCALPVKSAKLDC